eukprot:1352188-Rhodomonas_salina.1
MLRWYTCLDPDSWFINMWTIVYMVRVPSFDACARRCGVLTWKVVLGADLAHHDGRAVQHCFPRGHHCWERRGRASCDWRLHGVVFGGAGVRA